MGLDLAFRPIRQFFRQCGLRLLDPFRQPVGQGTAGKLLLGAVIKLAQQPGLPFVPDVGADRTDVGDRQDQEQPQAFRRLHPGGEIGAGFGCVEQKGTEHRDEMTPEGFLSNHAGGVLGGISSGQPIVASIALKPTSSLRLPGRSIDVNGNPVEVITTGRHDPCVGIRATPIAEAMMAIVLMDHYLRHRGQNGDVSVDTPVLGQR